MQTAGSAAQENSVNNIVRFLFDDTVTVLTVDSASYPLLEQSSPPAHQLSRSRGPARLLISHLTGSHLTAAITVTIPLSLFHQQPLSMPSIPSMDALCPVQILNYAQSLCLGLSRSTTVRCEFWVKL